MSTNNQSVASDQDASFYTSIKKNQKRLIMKTNLDMKESYGTGQI